LRDYKLAVNGITDPLAMGVPRSWEVLTKMPETGVFSVSYDCSPEQRAFALRRKFFEVYGCWSADLEDEDVSWWSSFNDVPLAVREFLEFISSRYESMDEAFVVIDGEKGNGKITCREFEEGIRKMKCKKFKGQNEASRISEIFRYLDPSGEGEISKQEWAVLNKMLKEIDLSIWEFVQFCDRTWPPVDPASLSTAWHALDEDGSGSITKKEWVGVLREAGFFGPALPIFCFIDQDDHGTVDAAVFDGLLKYRQRQLESGPKRRERTDDPSSALPVKK